MDLTNHAINDQKLWTKDFMLITFMNLFIALGFQMLIPIVPAYAMELGGTETWAGLVAGIFTLSAVIMRPMAGRLLDRQGRKGVFLAGLTLHFLCIVAYNWAPTVLFFFALRFIHGFGWGTSTTATSTMATDVIPKSRMGEGMGYFGLTVTLGMAVGPAISLGLVGKRGFGIVFGISAGLVIVAFLVSYIIRYREPEKRQPAVEEKQSMIDKEALKPGIVMALISMSYGAVLYFIALYAAQREVLNIGIFFTVFAIALFISRPTFGKIADRKGYSYAIYPGMVAVFCALIILFFAQTLGVFLVAGFVYGVGFGALQPTLQTMAVRDVEPSRRGAANATFYLGFDLGIGTGSILLGAVAESIGYQSMYLWSTITVVIALLLYLRMQQKRLKA